MAATNEKLEEIQKRVESVPGTAVAQELENNAKALLQQPENAALHYGVGLLYARVGDFGSSAKMLNVALNLTGNNEVILRALAYLYANQVGDHGIALDYLKKLHKLDKKNPATLMLIANSLLQSEKPKGALEYLEKVKPAKSHSVQFHFLRAQAYIQLGQGDQAKTLIDEIKKNPAPSVEPMIEVLNKQMEWNKLD